MKYVSYAFVFIGFATAALAEPAAVSALRGAVGNSDFSKVDAQLSQAQAGFVAGTQTADAMRALFTTLSRSDPQTVDFVADLLAPDPENPMAQIARACSIYHAAGSVRRDDNEISIETAEEMYKAVDDLAYAAYESNPDLIPASDAMVRGFADNRVATYFSLTALEAVLATHAHWGSVHRSLHNVSGRSAELTRGFCENTSKSFPEDEQEMIAHRCLMAAAVFYGRKDLRAYMEEHLWDDRDPELTIVRLQYFVRQYNFADAAPEQLEWAKTILLEYPVNPFGLVSMAGLARELQSNLQYQHGEMTRFTGAFAKARLPLAKKYLEQDPYNLDLIDMVDGVAFADDVMQNAVIYSNDRVWAINQLIVERQKQYMKFDYYRQYPPEQLQAAPEVPAFLDATHLPAQLLCPYLRAQLLRDEICSYYPVGTPACAPAPDDAQALSVQLHERALQVPECAGLLTASIEEMWYTETPYAEAAAS